jgi:hypothetical protein
MGITYLGKFDHDRSRRSPEAWFIMVYFREIIPKWPQDSG